MAGCGREFNGLYKVVGPSLRCGVNLYWRLPGSRPQDKAREQETLLCPICRPELTDDQE